MSSFTLVNGLPVPNVYVIGQGAGSGLPLGTGVNRSGSITTGGTAQPLAAANALRISFTFQNTSSGDLWINETGGTAVLAGGTGSFRVPPNQVVRISTNQALSVIGATTGQTYSATEV